MKTRRYLFCVHCGKGFAVAMRNPVCYSCFKKLCANCGQRLATEEFVWGALSLPYCGECAQEARKP